MAKRVAFCKNPLFNWDVDLGTNSFHITLKALKASRYQLICELQRLIGRFVSVRSHMEFRSGEKNVDNYLVTLIKPMTSVLR